MNSIQKERVIKEKLQKLTERMKEVGFNNYMVRRAKERIDELRQRGVYSVDKFIQKLLDRVNNKEDYLDILIEGRFAIILARNRFSEIHIEYCEAGPDLKANWNKCKVYFEVTRKRPNEDEWAEQSEATFTLPIKVENTIRKIREKIPQLQSGEPNIVVIWSDTVSLSKPELEEAFEYLKREIADAPEKYKDLSGVLLTEGGGVDIATLKQFYLFKNDNTSKPLGYRLTKKLESLHEQNFKKLQKEWEAIAAAIERL